jgi:hypothetical protein
MWDVESDVGLNDTDFKQLNEGIKQLQQSGRCVLGHATPKAVVHGRALLKGWLPCCLTHACNIICTHGVCIPQCAWLCTQLRRECMV